jgi:hypothetical protein
MLKFHCVFASSSTATHLPSDGKPYRLSFPSTTQVSELHQAARKMFKLDVDGVDSIKTRLWQVTVEPNTLARAQAQADRNTAGIDPSLDREPTVGAATRKLPSHLLSALSGKCISSDSSQSSRDGKDPFLSESDIEDADCFALEIAHGTAEDPRWPVRMNEAGVAEEIPVESSSTSAQEKKRAPLFSQPALFSGNGLRPSSSDPGRRRQEVVPEKEKKRQSRGLKGLSNLGVSALLPSFARFWCTQYTTFRIRSEHVFHEQWVTVFV